MVSEYNMSETASIADMADKISKDIFRWFKWERLDLMDQNFSCRKPDKHAPKKENHTHPVDVLFHYVDPYINKRILLNTDLKSYAKKSITTDQVRKSLQSLAKTIECARISSEWRERYVINEGHYEIRGLLFIYNHDGEYHKDFYNVFKKDPDDKNKKPVRIESINVAKGQQLHIIEPQTIHYLTTIISDMHKLHQERTFPEQNYYFHYPDLHLHKANGNRADRPATIEMLCSPYIIVEHDEVKKFNETTGSIEECYPKGFVIYYNKPGNNVNEFIYLFDTLSKCQILDGDVSIRVRVANSSYNRDIHSVFKKAITSYSQGWGFDTYKQERLEKIKLEVIETSKSVFSPVEIGWRNI